MIVLFEGIFVFTTIVMIVYLARHFVFTIQVLRQARYSKVSYPVQSEFRPTVTVLIPARNEKYVIARLLKRITELTYPKSKMQVIVIDDASWDGTGQIASDYSDRYPFIEVLHREINEGGKGKTSAMNVGFQKAIGEITLCFDADYLPQTDIVEKLTMPFQDPRVGAVQGRVVVLNEPQNVVTRMAAMERMGGYRVDQQARNNLNLITQFGGTVGGFRSGLLRDLGGWDEGILAEDTDLTFRVYLAGFGVRYVGDAESYEEAVDSWRAYWIQRYRWARGHMQCCFKHSMSLVKSKKIGVVAKIDGILLLNVYFMPLIVFLSVIVGIPLILLDLSNVAKVLWFSIPISLYSFVGNFAPFFEVGIGAYLDGRRRTQWLMPLLAFTFLYNIPICTKAFLDVIASKMRRRNRHPWVKTQHLGNGNRYIVNHSITMDRSECFQ